MSKAANSLKTSVYIVNKNYRVIYGNKRIRGLFPDLQVGDLCYKVFCKGDAPCVECPLKKAEESEEILFYNNELQQWIVVDTADVDMPGHGECSMLIAKQIGEGNRNLLFNLTKLSAYDELHELNLKEGSYKAIYENSDDPYFVSKEGEIKDAIQRMAEDYVHPVDRKMYLDFWNLDTMRDRIESENNTHILTIQFRRKTENGYRWIVQTIVPAREGAREGNLFLCFEHDIHDQIMLEVVEEKQPYDIVTGLYKRFDFFKETERLLSHAEKSGYCMIAIDIENFKLFNKWYGIEAGNKFLMNIGNLLKEMKEEYGGVAGHIGGDDFAILLPYDEKIIEDLQSRVLEYVRQFKGNAGFLPAFAIYVLDDLQISASMMYDRAVLALSEAKKKYTKRSAYYKGEMMQKMEEDYILLSEVQRALENGEFIFYGQPKCNMRTGKIVGLESLVRWQHPTRGLIFPGEFVPFLESNGFITNLDIYVWEEVCKSLRRWMDTGHRPVPISVNVSQADIFSLNIVEHFVSLIRKYNIAPELLEIEITESFYSEDYHVITKAIEGLRNAGFTILMDDFGSGYSSLNMLTNINVDIIKIDMKFLEMREEEKSKGTSILETIVQMARLMSLRVIVEGVETREQVDFLLDIGCTYCQGSYFYRPMPPEVFEAVLFEESNIDFDGCTEWYQNYLAPREFLNCGLISDTMLNNILGAVAIYDVCESNVEIVRVNEQYFQLTDTNLVNLEEKRKTIIYDVTEVDREIILELFRKAKQNIFKGAEGDVRRIRGDGSVVWVHMRIFFINTQDGHDLFYAALSDVTVQKSGIRHLPILTEEALKSQTEVDKAITQKLISVLHMSGINGWEWNIENHIGYIFRRTCLYPGVNHKWFDDEKEYLKTENFPECLLREENIPFGYLDSVKEFQEKIRNNRSRESISMEFPLKIMEEKTVWLQVECETILDETGNPIKAVGYYKDISRQKEQKLQLTKMAETDALTGLYNRVAVVSKITHYLANGTYQSGALLMVDLDDFKQANDVFGHSFGDFILADNAQKLKGFFRSNDIVGRMGGDEFIVFCAGIPEKSLENKLEQMEKAMTSTYSSEDREIKFSFSCGYVMIPEQGVKFEELYQKADIALFAAKLAGKGLYRKYHPEMKKVRYELAKERDDQL